MGGLPQPAVGGYGAPRTCQDPVTAGIFTLRDHPPGEVAPKQPLATSAHERPSNQVSNNHHRQQWTPADDDGRYFRGQTCRSPGSPYRYLASGRRGHWSLVPRTWASTGGPPRQHADDKSKGRSPVEGDSLDGLPAVPKVAMAVIYKGITAYQRHRQKAAAAYLGA